MNIEADVTFSIYQVKLCPIQLLCFVVLWLLLFFAVSSLVWHPFIHSINACFKNVCLFIWLHILVAAHEMFIAACEICYGMWDL